MFPAPYFCPGYFAPPYWVDGLPALVVSIPIGGGGTPTTVGNYFAPGYYSGYFAPAYWPGGPTPVVSLNLFDSAVAWLRTKVASSFPGGFHHGYRGSSTNLTYAVLNDEEDGREYSSERTFVAEGNLAITVLAVDRPTAVAAMKTIEDALENAPLSIQGCKPMYIGAGTRRNVRDDELGITDTLAVRESRAFPYMYSGLRTGPN